MLLLAIAFHTLHNGSIRDICSDKINSSTHLYACAVVKLEVWARGGKA